ncbi:hypothetical protein [Novosphingobium rosa]|uniref:hypothetical protein n=1 Tax=Novosphingobium rosa TaxID=76978 RepID=UPI000ABE2FE5|nr:hypothetical protein [Novosphingobium rosa]
MIGTKLRDSLAGFDDAALATLANAGLVRRARKDVEGGKVRLLSAQGDSALIEADGQQVALDLRGPRAAPCDCKAVTVCRHRIAAVIFVREAEDGPAEETPAGDPAEVIAALDLAALQRWAGKAGWRAALDLLAEAGQVEATPNAVSVHVAEGEAPVRILRGQGFDGIMSKASGARVKPMHAAAVLAARRHFGMALPAMEDVAVSDAEALSIDPAFLARVATSLTEVAASGFNLAPLPLEESLFELSVSSRADSLPRLSAMLRAIAAQLRLRRQRNLGFDPDRMLELAATAFALCRALGQADEARLLQLAGKLRRDFTPASPFHLVGCGGEQWRGESGARGVTAWFVEPGTGRWLSTTLARGAGQDPAFTPGKAWREQPLWHAEALATLAHARIDLEGARLSEDGRLSAPAEARATITARGVRPDPDWPGVVSDWDALRDVWLTQTGLGLDREGSAAACLIDPAGQASPYFDDLAQQLVWPLRDRNGQWLGLTLDHEEASRAIEALETQLRDGWKGMVLVRLARVGDRLEVRPVTLFGAGDPVDLSLWQRPWRADDKRPSRIQDWLARLKMKRERQFAPFPRSGTQVVLATAWRHLLDRAEVGPMVARSLDSTLEALARRLESYGLPGLAVPMQQAVEPESLLRAAYGLLIARQQRCALPLLR